MSETRLYQDVQMISNALRRNAAFETVEDYFRDAMIYRLAVEIAAEKVAEEVHEIVEVPVWHDARSQYAASMPPNTFRRRFLMHFWGLTDEDIKPRCVKHTVTVRRWIENPFEIGVRKQEIEDTMGFWA